jgi:1-acyl-sn-glycerol-3-phosphate acyltransferase
MKKTIYRKKTIYYEDELNDDFMEAVYKEPPQIVDDSYVYDKKNPFWRILSFVLYYFIALPLVIALCKVAFGLKVKGRKNLRNLKGGFYLYTNHTHWLDAFMPGILAWPKRAFIVCGPRAISSPTLSVVVPLLGGVPLNTTKTGKAQFRTFLNKQNRRGHVVAIMPEAHLWPYYNKIRKFSERSFTYPVRQNAPVVSCVLTYRRRKLFKNLPPLVTITVSEPIFPHEWKSASDPKMFLRDRALSFMRNTVEKEQSYARIKYHRAGEHKQKQQQNKTKSDLN